MAFRRIKSLDEFRVRPNLNFVSFRPQSSQPSNETSNKSKPQDKKMTSEEDLLSKTSADSPSLEPEVMTPEEIIEAGLRRLDQQT